MPTEPFTDGPDDEVVTLDDTDTLDDDDDDDCPGSVLDPEKARDDAC
ncbi:MAG TPA: hypothetical protein VM580_34720 [Labilithrix sp.]|nr:hypothetical protein [Labilithrix sp.]